MHKDAAEEQRAEELIAELLSLARKATSEGNLAEARDALAAAMDLPGGVSPELKAATKKFREERRQQVQRRIQAWKVVGTISFIVGALTVVLFPVVYPESLEIGEVTVALGFIAAMLTASVLEAKHPELRRPNPSQFRLPPCNEGRGR